MIKSPSKNNLANSFKLNEFQFQLACLIGSYKYFSGTMCLFPILFTKVRCMSASVEMKLETLKERLSNV